MDVIVRAFDIDKRTGKEYEPHRPWIIDSLDISKTIAFLLSHWAKRIVLEIKKPIPSSPKGAGILVGD